VTDDTRIRNVVAREHGIHSTSQRGEADVGGVERQGIRIDDDDTIPTRHEQCLQPPEARHTTDHAAHEYEPLPPLARNNDCWRVRDVLWQEWTSR